MASQPVEGAPAMLHIGVSLLGMIVAIFLLVEALAVRKVALGGAIAEKISYVVLAILCLAASALAEWAGNFVAGVTLEQTQLASEVLVIVAMALLAAYFYSVRAAMQRYVRAITGQQQLADELTTVDGNDKSETGGDAARG
jgi:predicted membrane-bound dolichyl-phosphate-mannose-protein mannosyltransferase